MPYTVYIYINKYDILIKYSRLVQEHKFTATKKSDSRVSNATVPHTRGEGSSWWFGHMIRALQQQVSDSLKNKFNHNLI
jgi:hypothetical protein